MVHARSKYLLLKNNPTAIVIGESARLPTSINYKRKKPRKNTIVKHCDHSSPPPDLL